MKPYVANFVLGSLFLRNFTRHESALDVILGEKSRFSFRFWSILLPNPDSITLETTNGYRLGSIFLGKIENYYLSVDESFSIFLYRAYVHRLVSDPTLQF